MYWLERESARANAHQIRNLRSGGRGQLKAVAAVPTETR